MSKQKTTSLGIWPSRHHHVWLLGTSPHSANSNLVAITPYVGSNSSAAVTLTTTVIKKDGLFPQKLYFRVNGNTAPLLANSTGKTAGKKAWMHESFVGMRCGVEAATKLAGRTPKKSFLQPHLVDD